MTMGIIKKYFLNIGVSYYKSEDFQFKKLNYVPIGNYGIGFLACFMLSDDVIIKTRHYKSSTVYEVSLTKDSPYICLREEEDTTFKGTEIILDYREFIKAFKNDPQNIRKFLEQYFITDGIDLKIIDRLNETTSSVTNGINISLNVNVNDTIIANITDYLVGIEGTVTFEIKKRTSHSSLEEITYRGLPYYYAGERLELINKVEEFDISKLYYNDTIRFISIPIIDKISTDLYDKFFEVLEDVKDTIEKIEDKIKWITIFLSNSIKDTLNSEAIEEGEKIVGDLYFEDLKELGHELEYQTITEVSTIEMVYRSDLKSFVRFNRAETTDIIYFMNEQLDKYI